MSTVAEAMSKLDAYAIELDQLSKDLADVSRALEPVEQQYHAFLADHELGLYDRSLTDEEFRLPAEKLRTELALRDMPADLAGRYRRLVSTRDRLRQRIGDVKKLVEAQRSLLSAMKIELEAIS